MSNAVIEILKPKNEQVLGYSPESREKTALKKKLTELQQSTIEIPLIIGGKEVRTDKTGTCIIPHNKSHVLAVYHMAGEKETAMAIQAALAAKADWMNTPSSPGGIPESRRNDFRPLARNTECRHHAGAKQNRL